MDIIDLIQKRRTCRSFKEDAIPDHIMDQLLDAACKSPSGGGFQTISIIKVTSQSMKKKLKPLCRNQAFIEKAPVSFIFCIDLRRITRICRLESAPLHMKGEFINLWMGIIDASISAQTLCLAGESFSLGSVYVGNLLNHLQEASKLFELPKFVIPAIMVTMGYPKYQGIPSGKYPYSVMVHENTYKDLSDESLLQAYDQKYATWQMQPKEKILNQIRETAYQLEGLEFSKACMEAIDKKQSISPYQYWFGSYYSQDETFMQYEDFVKYMKEQGFDWMGA